MSERRILWLMSLALIAGAVVCGGAFVLTGFSLGWMLATAACLVGSFMAFLIGVVA